MNFKEWLKTHEATMNSAGVDTNPTATNQNADKVATAIAADPANVKSQVKLATNTNPTVQNRQALNMATRGAKKLSSTINAPTALVAANLQKQFNPKPTIKI
jgi:hypothetical protein